MPTSSAGTPYTAFSHTLGGNVIRWAIANAHAGDSDIPYVLYLHGSGGGSNQFETLGAWAGMRDWLIDNGWAWVESIGGGNRSWGNDAARADYQAADTYVRGVLDLDRCVILGRSMGGVAAYWLALYSTVTPHVSGVIINSGVTDLIDWATLVDPTGDPYLLAAYGATDLAELASNSAGHNPMDFPVNDWAGQKVLQLYGTADDVVPAEANAIPWIAKYGDKLDTLRVDVRAGGDHSAGGGSYTRVEAMAAFLAEVTGTTPPAPVEPVMRRITNAFHVVDGRRHRIVAMR